LVSLRTGILCLHPERLHEWYCDLRPMIGIHHAAGALLMVALLDPLKPALARANFIVRRP
jgi:hypothetical protein